MTNSSFLILAYSVVLSYKNGKQPLQNIVFCQLFDEISRKAVKRRLPSTKSGHHQGHNHKPKGFYKHLEFLSSPHLP